MKKRVVAMKFIFNSLLLIGMIFAIGLGVPDTSNDTSPDNVPIEFAVADVNGQNVSDEAIFIAVNDVGKQKEATINDNLYNRQSENLPGITTDYNLPIKPGWRGYDLRNAI